jgi:acetyltransferase-like isoleucine patch superfamily enzyme
MVSFKYWLIWQLKLFWKNLFNKKQIKANWRSMAINSYIADHCDIGRSILINSSMDKYSYVNSGSIHFTSIGKFCSIGQNVSIGNFAKHPLNISTHPSFFHKNPQIGKSFFVDYDHTDYHKIKIGNDVWIGNNVLIMDGTKIGNGSVIGSGSIVTKDVEEYSIVAGSPAKLIRKRFSDREIKVLDEIKWWDMPEEKIIKIASLIASSNVNELKEKIKTLS